MRRLYYIPILHTEKEAGLIQGSERRVRTVIPLKEMWVGLQKKIYDLKLDWKTVCLYQEALPVCGREEEIVRGLSIKGSTNHRLLLSLVRKGARLEGTEDVDLLISENDLLTRALNNKDSGGVAEYRQESDKLLERRDTFIARRIRETLKEGETGLAFMGVRHRLDQSLKNDFQVSHIIYRIPFETVKTVFNL